MKFISLGGVGGCDVASSLRAVVNQPSYPYDWLISAQSFVIDSFLNFENFFEIDERFVHNKTFLLNKNKNAVMLHDFKKFNKEEITIKYKRRFERLNESMRSNNEIVFIRAMENLTAPLIPRGFYDDIYIREEDDISLWSNFINTQQNKFNKQIRMLLLAHNKKLVKPTNNPNLSIQYVLKKNDLKATKSNIERISNTIKGYI